MLKKINLYPVLSAGFVQAALALLFAFGVHLSPGVTGAIEAVAAAVLGLWTAVKVQPLAPAVITGLFTAVGTLLIALKLPHVSGQEVSALNALVVIIMTSVLHGNVSSNAAIKAAAATAQPIQPRHGG